MIITFENKQFELLENSYYRKSAEMWDKLSIEAELVNLKIEGYIIGDSSNLMYRCNICNTLQYKHIYKVRKGLVRCKTCFENKLKDAAIKHGFKYIPNDNDDVTKNFSCNSCGHIDSYRHTHMIDGKIKCDNCYELKLSEEANNAGLILLSKEYKKCEKSNRWYKHKSCSHIEYKGTNVVRKKEIECKICFEEKITKEAEMIGLTIVGSGKSGYRKYKLPCNCIRELRLDQIRNGFYSCDIHDNNRYTKKSILYFLKIKHDEKVWLKVGITQKLEHRIKEYKLIDGCIVTELLIYNFSSGKDSYEIEQRLHTTFRNKRLTPSNMKIYMQNGGFTECYPIEMFDEINEFVLENYKEIKC